MSTTTNNDLRAVGSLIGLALAEIANAVKIAVIRVSCICDEVENFGLDCWTLLEQSRRLFTPEVRYEWGEFTHDE